MNSAIFKIMRKIAICQLKGRVAPRYNHSTEIIVFTINNRKTIEERWVIPISDMEPADLTALLSRMSIEVVICGGTPFDCQELLRKHNVPFIDNVIGDVDAVFHRYIAGKLNHGDIVD
jgi:hypothetical protein